MAGQDPLAQRLRSLRTLGWPGRRVTQTMLAEALGVSPALISSWENVAKPVTPPVYRLEAYATFFASERSVERNPCRVLALSELAEDELARRDELLADFLHLNDSQPATEFREVGGPFGGTFWRFPSGEDITIVCSELPGERLKDVPYTNPNRPDYVELYKYADLDALIELFGHLRAANPASQVSFRVAAEMAPGDYANHLVLLGGVDWNAVTAELQAEIDLPVRQIGRPEDSTPGGFEIGEKEQRILRPVFGKQGQHEMLKEDVAHFYRATNPFNEKRAVTICNGMYQRGTLGMVRALTDEKYRDRNDQYIRTRFAGTDKFSIVSRVRVVNGVVITPDWTRAEDRLHEWPETT